MVACYSELNWRDISFAVKIIVIVASIVLCIAFVITVFTNLLYNDFEAMNIKMFKMFE